MKKLFTIFITTIAFTLGGCASVQSQQREEVSVVGKVVAVRDYQGNKQVPNAGGAVLGAIGGGVIGHQFGKGDGKTAMTVLGVLGGAVAGSQINKTNVPVSMQELTVLMPDGQTLNISVEVQNGVFFQQGQNVKITTKKGNKAEIQAI